jgi:hypothetical protein
MLQAFRLLDLKDGKLDGQIDLPTEQYMKKHVSPRSPPTELHSPPPAEQSRA